MQDMIDKHIDWIDGAKGVAIICVILLHCLPDLDAIYYVMHIGQAVSVFVFITSYLIAIHYKSLLEYFSWKRITKMLRTMLPPFLIVLACEVLVNYIHFGEFFHLKSLFLAGGCYGPGSYYLFLYLSLWILCPFVTELVKRTPWWLSFIVMLAISIASEYAVVLMMGKVSHLEALYRLAPIRYLMILWLGAAYPQFTKRMNILFVIVAIFSGVILTETLYVTENQHITPPYWNGRHWYSVLYCFLPVQLLQKVHYSETLLWLGKHSWQIFCFQMFVFWCVMINSSLKF